MNVACLAWDCHINKTDRYLHLSVFNQVDFPAYWGTNFKQSTVSGNPFAVKRSFEKFAQPLYNLEMKSTSITLNDELKPVIHPDSFDELREAWRLLGFTHEQPAIVIVGGAGGMTDDDIVKVQWFFEKHLIPFARAKNAAIIDGGTSSGVMAAIGLARKQTGGHLPLIGVAARDIEKIETMLEPNHTHFILCPGNSWGDESEWIAAAASALSASRPSVTIMINGGQIAWNDARVNIQYGRPILIAEGSGRTADVIATTSTGLAFDRQAVSLLRTGKVFVENFFKEPERFVEKLNELMK